MITIRIRYCGDVAELVRTSGGRATTETAGVAGAAAPYLDQIRRLPQPTSIKDAVEASGVPHCEIGQLRLSREHAAAGAMVPAKLDDIVADGDLVEVTPPRRQDLAASGFICAQHLGKLARLLRIMGFDVSYESDWCEAEIARRAVNEQRVLLSRGRAVLMRRAITAGLLVRADDCDEQAIEVARRYRIAPAVQLFGRCGLCNGHLRAVAKQQVASRIPPRTARWLDAYYLCDRCDQLYWEGTHVPILRRRVARILARAESGHGD